MLTCIGMFIYERLRRVHMCLKEEENACQVLAAVAVHALCRSFDMAVEKKRGISNLELLYKEISRAEKAKEQRKEQKKLKKKKKKNDKKCADASTLCLCNGGDDDMATMVCTCGALDENGYDSNDDQDETTMNCCNNNSDDINSEMASSKANGTGTDGGGGGDGGGGCCNAVVDDISIDVKDEISLFSCHTCVANVGGNSKKGGGGGGGSVGAVANKNRCSKSIDGGYVSEPSNHDGPCSSVLSSRTSSMTSSPEGSEIACSDGFCNHDQQQHHSRRSPPEYICGGRHSALSCLSTSIGGCGGGKMPQHQTPIVESQLSLQQMLVSCASILENDLFVL